MCKSIILDDLLEVSFYLKYDTPRTLLKTVKMYLKKKISKSIWNGGRQLFFKMKEEYKSFVKISIFWYITRRSAFI